MGSKFISLPIGAGESFLLQTRHEDREWVILVDSGNLGAGSSHPLVKAIQAADGKVRCIDIAICTHKDKDHSNGFRRFADEWYKSGGKIREFWLPGRWAAAFPNILTDPYNFSDSLLRGTIKAAERLAEIERNRERQSTFESRLRIAAMEAKINDLSSEVTFHGDTKILEPIHQLIRALGVTDEGFRAIETSLEETDYPPSEVIEQVYTRSRNGLNDYWWYSKRSEISTISQSLFTQAIETAHTIALIAESAIRNDILIRWFDFGQFERNGAALGGVIGFLEPLSSVELLRPPQNVSDEVLFFSLHLSQQNVESLVFYRLETNTEPGVIFAGDSRLCFGIDKPEHPFPMPQKSPSRQILITAPHHGSRVNDEAYKIIKHWLPNSELSPIFVRNGGHHKSKLEFFLKERFRCCTQCRHCVPQKRPKTIRLNSQSGRWIWPKTRSLKC
jgi:hypothetical protein